MRKKRGDQTGFSHLIWFSQGFHPPVLDLPYLQLIFFIKSKACQDKNVANLVN
jgi:hypothetical protein